jgi:formamidopyrimidine-DNA glycosylase
VPELPEVETIRRHVELALVGHRLLSVEVGLPKLLRDSPLPNLNVLEGTRLISANRRAKVLVLGFDSGLSLLVHFKLAGQWAIVRPDGSRLVAGHPIPDPRGPLPHKTTHVTFRFEDGSIAYFSDVRQFGWLRLMPADSVCSVLDGFGFGPEGSGELDTRVLVEAMGRRGIPVKTLLLDQSFVAGLGNIYADEVLFRAGVHPARPANSLKPGVRRSIIEAIPQVLAEGISQGGAKIIHNRAQPLDGFPAVHGRAGEPCFRCGNTVVKTRVGGRGTYSCPRCQKAPRERRPSASRRHPGPAVPAGESRGTV